MKGNRINDLEKRIEHLEYQVSLLAEIADVETYPFIYAALEANLTKSQVKAIYDLMDEEHQAIKTGKPINHHEFEKRIYEIVPSRRGDYHFAENIVSTLNDKGRWVEIYNHLKKDGMNI